MQPTPSKNPSSPAPPWRPSSPAIDAGMFDDVIAGGAVFVHFWAPWNPYDRTLDANLQELRPKFPRLRFYSANADETAFAAAIEAHHVAAFPAIVCFANGRSRGRFYGVETLEALEAFLREMSEAK